MNRIKRLLGLNNVLERAWAETQVDSPDTVMLAGYEDADAALEAMRLAAVERAVQGESHAHS